MTVDLRWASTLLNRFRIPTILGLFIIFSGIGAGVFLASGQQLLTTQASPDPKPIDILVTNIQDESAVISWKTADKTIGYVKYGEDGLDSIAIDDLDKTEATTNPKTQPRIEHYVTIRNLIPKTTYLFQINSGNTLFSDVHTFDTAASSLKDSSLKPLFGTVSDGTQFAITGTVFLTIPGRVTQTALISKFGSFTIPLSKVYNDLLTDIMPENDDQVAKLQAFTPSGTATAKIIPSLINQPLELKVGQDLDFTQVKSQENTEDNVDVSEFDLNHDGVVNAADETIVKTNLNKKLTPMQGDFYKDGIVDKKDLELIRQKMTDLSKSF